MGLDASKEFLSLAEKAHPQLTFIEGNVTDFKLEKPVDIVFSNAVFHWISKERQQSMLNCIFQALKPGGEFVFELGGTGNNARIHAVFEKLFEKAGYSYQMPFYFPGIAEYATRLEKAGFQVRYAVLFDRMTELKGKEGLKDWIEMFLKTPLSLLPSPEREKIIEQAVDLLKEDLFFEGKWHADYVRLRMKAIRL